MSRAFVKESEGEWLGDVAPDVRALEKFLSRENGEIITEVRKTFDSTTGRDIHEMSNGDCYSLNEDGRWEFVR